MFRKKSHYVFLAQVEEWCNLNIWCNLQVKLCDPYLSALSVRSIQIHLPLAYHYL